jgi:hypothetical protein
MAFRIVLLCFGQIFLKTMGVGRDPRRSRGRHNRSSRSRVMLFALSFTIAIIIEKPRKKFVNCKTRDSGCQP